MSDLVKWWNSSMNQQYIFSFYKVHSSDSNTSQFSVSEYKMKVNHWWCHTYKWITVFTCVMSMTEMEDRWKNGYTFWMLLDGVFNLKNEGLPEY
jgi:hypothetical protein